MRPDLFSSPAARTALDFDLDLAKKKTNENPVYYVQYVHARICSIEKKATEQGIATDAEPSTTALSRLTTPEELALIKWMDRFTETIEIGALRMEPHRVTFYLMDLASAFHAYYNKHRVLTEDAELTTARLFLIRAVRKVIRNGLRLLGVTAPEQM